MSGTVIGKGVVKNLSRTGLRVLGDHSLTPGTLVCVRLIEGADAPLEIARASVRWVNQSEFGLQIEHVTAHAAKRIARLINAGIGLPPDCAQ
jgi:hypothetical protein